MRISSGIRYGLIASAVSVVLCGHAYAVPYTLTQILDSPSPNTGDLFGISTALDGSNVLVGAPRDDTNGRNVGQAYLFDAITGALLQTFDDPTPTQDDHFGNSVSLFGNHALIGAPFDDTNVRDKGQAHLFDTTTGALLRTFSGPTGNGAGSFGFSVALSGNNALIGAPVDIIDGPDIGQAYLFNAETGNLLHTFDEPTPSGRDNFGISVALDGNNVAIGAAGVHSRGRVVAGQAYIFDAATGVLKQTFEDPTLTTEGSFGLSIDIDENNVIVGGALSDGTNIGQAYLFDSNTGTILEVFENPDSGLSFGNTVAIDANNILIGARSDGTNGPDLGRAYLFDASTGELVNQFDDPTPTFGDSFGHSVSLDGNNVLIGATKDDTLGTNVGQAYLFTVDTRLEAPSAEVVAAANAILTDTSSEPGKASRLTNFSSVLEIVDFDKNSPTFVITHGWQPQDDYTNSSFDFNDPEFSITDLQKNTITAIKDRLLEEAENNGGNVLNTNILVYEWEGSYTGGFPDGFPEDPIDVGLDVLGISAGSIKARNNAEAAGEDLSNKLSQLFGSDYSRDIHFIGHSYGTIVNGIATESLDKLNISSINQNVQFTTLDAPTDAPLGFAPNFDNDWFTHNLSPKVDYLDNYFGDEFSSDIVFPLASDLRAYGEPILHSSLNQQTDYSHSGVGTAFYPELILLGEDADTNPFGLDVGRFRPKYDDWVTPILETFKDRPGTGFFSTESLRSITIPSTLIDLNSDLDSLLVQPISTSNAAGFQHAIGTPSIAPELIGLVEFQLNATFLKEQSPVVIFQTLVIPLDAELLAFDYLFDVVGDGDWVTVHFDDELLWSMLVDLSLEGELLDALIDISEYAGQERTLFVALHSVGESNAEFYIGNLEFLTSSVPEPAMLGLFGIGLAGLCFVRRRKAT